VKDALTGKQKRFVNEYLIDMNASRAALAAGYSERTAHVTGNENLKKPAIQKALIEANKSRVEKTEISADYVLSNLKALTDRCMTAVPCLDKEGNNLGFCKFDSKGAARGLELLGKHLSLFIDKTELTGANGQPLIPERVEIKIIGVNGTNVQKGNDAS